MGVPTTLAPRGMLGAGALSVKPWRKRAWLWMQTGAYRDIRWHASTEQEADEIRAWFPDATVDVALNFPVPFDPAPSPENLAPAHPERRAHPSHQELPLRGGGRGIAGASRRDRPIPHRRPHRRSARSRAPQGAGRAVQLDLGGVPPTETRDHFAWADLVLVPSFNENFGHAVAEAVATGRPALVSDQTAWSSMNPDTASAVFHWTPTNGRRPPWTFWPCP